MRENTMRTREWEKSKFGLDSEIMKIKRNSRRARYTVRAKLRKDSKWLALPKEKQDMVVAEEEEIVRKRYNDRIAEVKRIWYGFDEETANKDADGDDDCDDGNNDGNDNGDDDGGDDGDDDGGDNGDDNDDDDALSDPYFEGNEDDEDKEGEYEFDEVTQGEFEELLTSVYDRCSERFEAVIAPFEKWGSYDEEPMSSDEEETSEEELEEEDKGDASIMDDSNVVDNLE